MAVMSLIGTAAAPVLDPVRGSITQDRFEAVADRILARLDAVKVPFFAMRRLPVSLNCLAGWPALGRHVPSSAKNRERAHGLNDDIAD